MKLFAAFLALLCIANAQDYTAERTTDHGIPVVRLVDKAYHVEVAVAPTLGNMGYEMKVNGKNILYFPYADLAEYQSRPVMSGIPFLAPWANRLDQDAFYANGKKYNFDMEFGNVRGQIPLHGLLSNSSYWEVSTVTADSRSARYTARLRFWRYPELMAQWPFAHEYEMTYQLKEGELEVRLTVSNLSVEPMPVVVGFHPYYQIPDIPRDQYVAHIPARTRVMYDDRLIPTGKFQPMDLADEFSLRGITFDNGFTDLVYGTDHRSHFYIKAGDKTVEATFGPKYTNAVVWSPNQNGQPQPFICFEPMSGIVNAANMGNGNNPHLQTVAPGARWTESFWIKATGI